MFGIMPWKKEEKGGYYPPMPLRNEFEALFNRFFGPTWLEPVRDEFWGWNMETEDAENEFRVRMELPGFEPPEVDVLVTGDRLTVRAEHKKEVKEENKEMKVEYTERHFGKFERSFMLPPGVDAEKAEAVYRNGMLAITLPKVPAVRPRKIEVKK
jgi:HSP20 family protein